MGKTKRVANGDNVPRVGGVGLKCFKASKVCLPLVGIYARGVRVGKPHDAVLAHGVLSGLGDHGVILWNEWEDSRNDGLTIRQVREGRHALPCFRILHGDAVPLAVRHHIARGGHVPAQGGRYGIKSRKVKTKDGQAIGKSGGQVSVS
jgi:hypothetical protein